MFRKIAATMVLLFWVVITGNAQSISDSISYIETFNAYKFYHIGQPISADGVSSLMENNYDAYDAFESGREAKVFGYVFFSIGSGLVIYPFITSVLGKETNWAFTFAGMGFAGLSIPMFYTYHKKTEQAIEFYNGSLVPTSSGLNHQKSLNLNFSGSGIGLAYQF